MTDIWQYLKTADKPIFLYGMGNGAQKIINTLDSLNVKVSGVFASDDFVRDKTFMGFKITDYNTVRKTFGDVIVIVAFGTQLPDVMQNIYRIADETELYAPELPVIGDGLFDSCYYLDNKSFLDDIRSKLADDTSRIAFDGLVNFKLTGNINFLKCCETSPAEVYANIIAPGKNDVFVDLGAYRGDTVTEYINYAGGYERIYAIEPDVKTFKKLIQNVPGDITCLNLAVSDKKGVASFDMQSGRSSHLSKNGITVPSDTIDNILNGGRADYIKMDVEGAEREALLGAINTILKYKPKLCVSAYHRAYDLLDIPKQVLSIRDDYKIYLRHFPYIPAWDTNYYFI